MKRFLSIAILAIAVTSCTEAPSVQNDPTRISTSVDTKSINSLGKFPYNDNIDELVEITIDGCDYIVCNARRQEGITITHKGNCKFCMERQEILIQKYTGKFIKDTLQ